MKRPRVQVWSNRKMVTLQGDVVVPAGESDLLSGVSDGTSVGIAAVKLDDGRELLIATRDLEEEAPATQREPSVLP